MRIIVENHKKSIYRDFDDSVFDLTLRVRFGFKTFMGEIKDRLFSEVYPTYKKQTDKNEKS